MLFLQIIAVVFSFLCIMLTIKKNVWCWIFGIVATIAFSIIFYHNNLYSQVGVQLIFMLQNIYGWYNWNKNYEKETHHLRTQRISKKQLLYSFIFVLCSFVIIGNFLYFCTDASAPFFDVFAASLGLTANYLLTKRILENWVFWIIADFTYLGIFIFKGAWMMSGIYGMFIIMAIIGLNKWLKEYRK